MIIRLLVAGVSLWFQLEWWFGVGVCDFFCFCLFCFCFFRVCVWGGGGVEGRADPGIVFDADLHIVLQKWIELIN